MDHIETKKQRDFQPRLLDGHALSFVDISGSAHVEKRTDQAPGDEIAVLITNSPDVWNAIKLLQLTDLFLERHPRQQPIDAPFGFVGGWRWPGGRAHCQGDEQGR